MKREIFIIGSGPGAPGEITGNSAKLLEICYEVYVFDRIGDLYSGLLKDIIKCSYQDIEEKIRNSQAQKIAVLVSGDVGFFSIAKKLNEKFRIDFDVFFICGISSLQYFCSKIKLNYEDVKTVSLHGREGNLQGSIAYNRYTFVLTGGPNNASKVLKELYKNGISGIKVTAGELLSMPDERILCGTVEELSEIAFDSLTVLLFENENYVNKDVPLFDKELSRNETPMTKQEVRWFAVNLMRIEAGDVLFDIGAGSGSVAIEMGRKAHEGLVFAIEKTDNAYELLCKNKYELGALNVIPLLGEALEEIVKLPVPDKVFIGGSGGNLNELIKSFYKENKDVKMVITAITLETLNVALETFKEINFKTDIVCLNCSRSKKAGNYNMMIASNPVYIISGEKDDKSI
jgi:precorrin-6B C5,15-methyltransferase / cobalt-precorrin-6B C5,C15-methyltransferase